MSHEIMTDIAAHIACVMCAHKGRENAIRRDDLLASLQYETPELADIDDRLMRKAIAAHLPWVCSSGAGYYMASTLAEKRAAIGYLGKKIRGLRARMDALAAAYPELEKYVQMELGL